MGNYTAEQVEEQAEWERCNSGRGFTVLMLRAYAATLRQQAGRVDEAVAKVVRRTDGGMSLAFIRHVEPLEDGTLFYLHPAALAQNTQREAVAFPMTEQQVRQWIDACNSESARQVLRDYLGLRTLHAERARVPDAREALRDLERSIGLNASGAGIDHDNRPSEYKEGWIKAYGHCLDMVRKRLAAAPSQRAEVK